MVGPADKEALQASDTSSKVKKSKSQKKKPSAKESRSNKSEISENDLIVQDKSEETAADRLRQQSDQNTYQISLPATLNGPTSSDLGRTTPIVSKGRPQQAVNGQNEHSSNGSSSNDEALHAGGAGEIAKLQQALNELKKSHTQELESISEKLEETQTEKEHAESQYRSLLEKVGTIKAQLGERLKADAEHIAQARSQIEDLETQNEEKANTISDLRKKIAKMTEEEELKSKELSSFRNRMNLSQQNWVHEREELVNREAYVREEFEAAKQAMQDWEVLAMEERSIREGLSERMLELEEQLKGQREAFEAASRERDSQSNTVDGLQRALQEIQSARKIELRELVESSQAQVDKLKKELQDVEKQAAESSSRLGVLQKELERALPFEKEVKEKNLLIGKLRHEAVILNDHLTKALRFLKKGRPEDNVDRQIVTNHFLHFLALDRADPKKFQVLQLIAALLNWSDEQREQAGLTRPGAPTGSLRVQLSSPFLRTPSSPALSSELTAETPNRDSLAELWSNFLEQEAGSSKSRSESISTAAKPSPPPP